ncbi:Transcriptional repressor NrdR [Listeria grayi]|uniref:Transcriptional repressor NrdR n=1 Tax=Listeria grayi TaxID=1641 RepID=A0A378MHY7_LISGR|nr:Transcriptional repressor NrdR [Listeria grayi]
MIGEKVMDKLANLDEVAYVRFASVYRQFKDINVFVEELKELMEKNKER